MPARMIHPRSLLNLLTASRSPARPRFFCTHQAAAPPAETQKLERIADELLSLTKLERYDYSILFRLKMGIDKYGPAVSGVGSEGAGSGSKNADAGAAAAAEKTVFDIKLEKFASPPRTGTGPEPPVPVHTWPRTKTADSEPEPAVPEPWPYLPLAK